MSSPTIEIMHDRLRTIETQTLKDHHHRFAPLEEILLQFKSLIQEIREKHAPKSKIFVLDRYESLYESLNDEVPGLYHRALLFLIDEETLIGIHAIAEDSGSSQGPKYSVVAGIHKEHYYGDSMWVAEKAHNLEEDFQNITPRKSLLPYAMYDSKRESFYFETSPRIPAQLQSQDFGKDHWITFQKGEKKASKEILAGIKERLTNIKS